MVTKEKKPTLPADEMIYTFFFQRDFNLNYYILTIKFRLKNIDKIFITYYKNATLIAEFGEKNKVDNRFNEGDVFRRKGVYVGKVGITGCKKSYEALPVRQKRDDIILGTIILSRSCTHRRILYPLSTTVRAIGAR